MKLKRHLVFFGGSAIGLLLAGTVQAQLPEKPLIDYTSYDTATNSVEIAWFPSSAPKLRTYKIYYLNNPGSDKEGTVIDSTDSNTLSYIHTDVQTYPLRYTVTAVDSMNNESLIGGDYHQPVLCSMAYDSCNKRLNLSWTQYIGWGNELAGYRVFVRESGAFQEVALLGASRLQYTLENVNENSHYAFWVQAFSNQSRTSNSNIATYFTYMPGPPAYMNLDYVDVAAPYEINVGFTADISGEVNDFLISRAGGRNADYTPWKTFYNLETAHAEATDQFPSMSNRYYYRVEALNSCGQTMEVSNTGVNVLLQGEMDNTVARLEWTPYDAFNGTLEGYRVYRQLPGGEFEPVTTLPGDAISFSEDISILGSEDRRGEVGYYIEAIEGNDNPYGVKGISRSNITTLQAETHLYMPNAFTPNGDGQNDTFGPVMDFAPEDYLMIIFDRTGKRIFETTDPFEGWSGRQPGGNPAPAGVYVFHVEYTSYTGMKASKTGNLTLVPGN